MQVGLLLLVAMGGSVAAFVAAPLLARLADGAEAGLARRVAALEAEGHDADMMRKALAHGEQAAREAAVTAYREAYPVGRGWWWTIPTRLSAWTRITRFIFLAALLLYLGAITLIAFPLGLVDGFLSLVIVLFIAPVVLAAVTTVLLRDVLARQIRRSDE